MKNATLIYSKGCKIVTVKWNGHTYSFPSKLDSDDGRCGNDCVEAGRFLSFIKHPRKGYWWTKTSHRNYIYEVPKL